MNQSRLDKVNTLAAQSPFPAEREAARLAAQRIKAAQRKQPLHTPWTIWTFSPIGVTRQDLTHLTTT